MMVTIQRGLMMAGSAGVVAALWIATPVQSLADTAVPVSCPSLPGSPQGIAAPAPDVSSACPSTVTTATAPASQPATAGSAMPRTQTASLSSGSARPQGQAQPNAVGIAPAAATTPSKAATGLALTDRLLLSALGSAPPVATFTFHPPAPRTWALLANTIGFGAMLILMLAMLAAVMRSYDFQRFMAHRQLYG
jgi:hypothetical protein